MKAHTGTKRKYHHKLGFMYPATYGSRLYSIFLAPIATLFILALVLSFLSHTNTFALESVPLSTLLSALGLTFLRLIVAYALALVCAVPLALLANVSQRIEALLLPVFDIIESVPILVFFPIIILFFINVGFSEGAAIFIIFINMLWNLVFNLIGGLKLIPADIKASAQVFGVKGLSYVFKVLLPSVFPHLITGSLLAWAEGWNMIIVAEVLHTYLPNGTESQDLFGIGSILVHSSAHSDTTVFVVSVACVVLAIALLNFFVWQKLLRYSEKFRFE